MMSKEEVAEILTYCKEKGISYKSRLAELGIPEWKFYEGKSRYAKQQAESPGSNGEFLQADIGWSICSDALVCHNHRPWVLKEERPAAEDDEHRASDTERHNDTDAGRDDSSVRPDDNPSIKRPCLA